MGTYVRMRKDSRSIAQRLSDTHYRTTQGQSDDTEEEMIQETHLSVQHVHVQEEEVMEKNEARGQLGMNLNRQEGEKPQGKEGDPLTLRIKWSTAASKKKWMYVV